jgi:hypothetical protein
MHGFHGVTHEYGVCVIIRYLLGNSVPPTKVDGTIDEFQAPRTTHLQHKLHQHKREQIK